jgi:hypothetical protein
MNNEIILKNRNNLKTTILIVISLMLIGMLSFIFSTINDPDVFYEKHWNYISLTLIFINIINFIYLLYSYFNSIIPLNYIYLLLFILSGSFLVVFGYSKIFTNELIIPTDNASYNNKMKINDDITIYGLLVGFLVCFLCFVDIFRFIF